MLTLDQVITQDVILSASDIAAIRARLTGKPTPEIIKKHFTKTRLKALNLVGPAQVEEWLDFIRDQLLRVLCFNSTSMTITVANARRFNKWSANLIARITHEAKTGLQPFPDHPTRMWFRPHVVAALNTIKVHTLQELKQFIQTKGCNWTNNIRALGQCRRQMLEKWVREAHFLGGLVIPNDEPQHTLVVIDETQHVTVPLERMLVVNPDLTGEHGVNRGVGPNTLEAENDMQAIQSFLLKYRNQPQTLRAYTKEVERFLLWCLIERKKALSSIMVADCEAYKDFIANVPASWLGPIVPRNSARWRPFVGQLSPKSQVYAISIIRFFFWHAHEGGYLLRNPWRVVIQPEVENLDLLDDSKALSKKVWLELTDTDGILDQFCSQSKDELHAAHNRIVKCTILLMGTTGLRREEAATVTRNNLKPTENPNVWGLRTLGKGRKWRLVYVPLRVVNALKEHWKDRDHDFDDIASQMRLISPIMNTTKLAREKHYVVTDVGVAFTGAGFMPDSLYCIVKKALVEISDNPNIDMNVETRNLLRKATMHTFRHTFASISANSGIPIVTLKDLMGHVSLNTTSCYVHREVDETHKVIHSIFG